MQPAARSALVRRTISGRDAGTNRRTLSSRAAVADFAQASTAVRLQTRTRLLRRVVRLARLLAIAIASTQACRHGAPEDGLARSADPAPASVGGFEIVIQDYRNGLAGVQTANSGITLSLGDSTRVGDSLLVVDYSAPTADPAGRDIRLDAVTTDWRAGTAIAFRIKPDQTMRLSVSFLDRNRVAYTTWIDLVAGRWQPVRISLDAFRPNPYFQPPGAKTGESLDVSQVTGIAFAPQNRTAGRLAIGRIVVVR